MSASQRISIKNCINYDHNKKFGLFKFQSSYRKLYLDSSKGYSWKIINAQTVLYICKACVSSQDESDRPIHKTCIRAQAVDGQFLSFLAHWYSKRLDKNTMYALKQDFLRQILRHNTWNMHNHCQHDRWCPASIEANHGDLLENHAVCPGLQCFG